ncbi:hypothetical protein Dimus_028190 [Dionaea muscipula]
MVLQDRVLPYARLVKMGFNMNVSYLFCCHKWPKARDHLFHWGGPEGSASEDGIVLYSIVLGSMVEMDLEDKCGMAMAKRRKGIIAAISYEIWQKRNSRVFRNSCSPSHIGNRPT